MPRYRAAPENSLALRLKVQAVLTATQFGDFSPVAGSTPPLNAFVRLDQLQQAASLAGRANFVLEAGVPDKPPQAAPEALDSTLQQHWNIADAGLELEFLKEPGVVELRSPRVFLDPAIVNTVAKPQGTDSEQLLLTYLANLLQSGTNSTPYSMVTAAGPPYTPADMRDDEIIISQWLADDLRLKPGDTLDLSWFLPESGPALAESTNRFRVHAVVPLSGIYADRTLMPDFPGIEKADNDERLGSRFPG